VNGESKWVSRSFWITIYGMTGSFLMGWLLKDATIITVVVPVLVTNWFGGKAVEAYQNKKAGGA